MGHRYLSNLSNLPKVNNKHGRRLVKFKGLIGRYVRIRKGMLFASLIHAPRSQGNVNLGNYLGNLHMLKYNHLKPMITYI